jgi:dienelactone hydrolase
LALAAGMAAAAHAGDAYKLQPGPFPVRTIKLLVLDDAVRRKQLQLRVNYPDGTGLFPVIVWSHGAWGSKDNYLPLTEHWASHGYVTIQANHGDSHALGVRVGDAAAFRDWQSRPADISFILDSLDDLERREPALKGKLDGKRIGIGGHSFGAHTAQLVGGATAFLPGGARSFEDKRVTAVLLLSGQGPGEALTEKSWAHFARPLLVMTGSRDGPTRTGQPAEWRKKAYELSPSGDKYLVWVDGLDHGYGGITGVNFNPRNKPNPDHVAWTKIVTLAFWDTYLKQGQEARACLESGKLEAFSKGSLTITRK